jgi:uncharacterized membrane protein YsdA (DUF1294 family)
MQPTTLKMIIWIAYAVWNAVVFSLYAVDKRKAKKGEWRVSEKTLLLTAFLLGGAGAFLGMLVFRHKTKHTSFTVLVPLFAFLGLGAMLWLTTRL